MDFSTPVKSLEKLPGELTVATVHESNKQRLLDELVKKDIEIVGLELIKPSLEEIFYHIRSK